MKRIQQPQVNYHIRKKGEKVDKVYIVLAICALLIIIKVILGI